MAEQAGGRTKELMGRARSRVADERAKRARGSRSEGRPLKERFKDAKDAFKD